MRQKLKIIVIILLPTLLGGCWDLQEVEHIYYVHAAGFDYDNGKYYFYAQVIDFSPMAKKESVGGGEGETGVWVDKGVGKSLQEAAHDLYSNSERQISWGHLAAFVITERALDAILRDVIDAAERYPEIRLNEWVFGTDSPLQELFMAMPIIFRSPLYSQLGDPVDVFDQRSFVRPIRFHEFVRSMNEPGQQVLLPNIKMSNRPWVGGGMVTETVKMSGLYTIADFKKTGKLKDHELSGIRWMERKANQMILALYRENKPIGDILCFDPKIKIKPYTVNGGKLRIDLELKYNSEIRDLTRPFPHTYLKKMAEKEIENQIRHTYREALKKDIDIYNFSYYLFRDHNQLWHQLQKNGFVSLEEDTLSKIKVDVNINTGKKKISEVPWIKKGYDRHK